MGRPVPFTKAPYNYKYQEQERQEELGLNWDSFKWRNYDYAIGRFMNIDPLTEEYTYNSPYAFQENKMGMGRELEGLEMMPHDFVFNYVAKKIAQLASSTSTARAQLKEAVSNRAGAAVRGETTNVNIAGKINLNKGRDIAQIGKSGTKIIQETKKVTKVVVRDTADTLENTGDGMVIVAPATGPFAPVVSGVGGTMSAAGAVVNFTVDIAEEKYEEAGERFIKEITLGAVSGAVKKAPGVDESTSQIIDSHIEVYDNVIVPEVEENAKRPN
ncbi:MAG: hypothetical protein ACO1N9_01315 [Flavobacterium sp.]